MEARRSMALRPPQPANGVVVATGSGARAGSLKRTISKCGIDASMATSDSGGNIAPKKLAPLHESHTRSYHPTHNQHAAPNDTYVDDGKPVLLPRYTPEFADGEPMEGDVSVDDEYSPVAPFGWDGSPQAVNNRYYESILESSGSLVSPSPQHILYPYTPMSGEQSAASTISFGSSPYTPFSIPSGNNNAPPLDGVAQQALQDRESLSAANLHAIVTSYLEEIFAYYDLAKSFTFAKVTEMVASVPFAFKYIQSMVKNRLGISWHLVNSFVEHVLAFISDEDLREANVKEFADFLSSLQEQIYETIPARNIFLNLYEFFHHVLAKFKKYLIQNWLLTQRIQFPCEFGKKSDTLFLCMECHREHL